MASMEVEAARVDLCSDLSLFQKQDIAEECSNDNSVVNKSTLLSPGFPSCLDSKMVWTGIDLADESKYIYHLTNNEKLEIDAALTKFKEYELDGDKVSRDNFHLPTLQHVLRELSLEVHNGRGFFILRGLDLPKYSIADGTIIFLGIQSYIAEQRARQDDQGNILIHVISDPTPSPDPARASHQRHSTSSIPFHTDYIGGILSWQTRSSAVSGGGCILASTYTIYNELAATRPDIIQTLAQADWPFALPHYQLRPILFHHDNKIIFNFSRVCFLGNEAHPRPSTLPSITPRQLEALDAVEAIAEKHSVKFDTKVGDMHFVNNHSLLHRRESFQVYGDRKRLLVRLQSRSRELGWKVPEALRRDWDAAFEGEEERVYCIVPMQDSNFPLRQYAN